MSQKSSLPNFDRQIRLNCPPPHMAVKMGGGAAQAELLHAMMTQQVSLSCLQNILKRPIIERQCKQVRLNCLDCW